MKAGSFSGFFTKKRATNIWQPFRLFSVGSEIKHGPVIVDPGKF